MFAELGSAPATMEADKIADVLGLQPGHTVELSDAEQAYCQAKLKGAETWVDIPFDQWPKSWIGKYTEPVCPLICALRPPRCRWLLGGALQ